MRDLEEARNYFKDDRFATEASGIIIEAVDDGYAKCSMKIEDRHRNAVNQVMGGAIYTLADFVFAVATNTKDHWTVTTVSQISYIGTVKGDTLYAESRCIKDGRRTCFYEIEIKDDLGNLVAVVSTSGSHLEKK
ncbi:MAG: PaaI family thioesterase [Lachnospiraceae bacterium]|nr:PaaI family thioesterase [Lachnospiraceae bacterium]